jgi:hypothetical protein
MIHHQYVEQLERDLEAMTKDRDGLKAALLAQVKQQSHSVGNWAKESAALKIRVGMLERDNAALRSLSTLNNNEGMLNENRLLAERDRLLRKIDVLREDKERLDWLAARGEPQTYEDAPHSLVWYVLGEDRERDLRAAIDAARAKEEKP